MLKNQTIQIKNWFLDILSIFIMIINAKWNIQTKIIHEKTS